MFSDPEFLQDYVDSESSAVNSEYEIDIADDDWKLTFLITELSKIDHP